jgi:hypothetical protein
LFNGLIGDVPVPVRDATGPGGKLIGDVPMPATLAAVLNLGASPQNAGWHGEAAGLWKKAVTDTVAAAVSDLKAIRDAAADPKATRPPAPTADYCLLPGYRVRWKGKDPLPPALQPQLWHLLKYLLSRKSYPFEVGDLEKAVWEGKQVTKKTVPNALSRLTIALEAVAFPWSWHVGSGHVHRDG